MLLIIGTVVLLFGVASWLSQLLDVNIDLKNLNENHNKREATSIQFASCIFPIYTHVLIDANQMSK